MTQRLVASLDQYWVRIDGQMARQGVDPMELPFDRLLSVIYVYLIGESDEDQIQKFDLKLFRPPPGWKAPITEGPWSAGAERSALSAFAVQVGLKKAAGQKVGPRGLEEGDTVSGGRDDFPAYQPPTNPTSSDTLR